MVRLRFFWFLIPLLTLLAVMPASADGILEQMENEVSSIVTRTKGAVVSIYDARLPGPINRAPMSLEQKQEMASRLRDLQMKEKTLDATIAQLQSKIKAGENQADVLAKAQKERENLDAQIGTTQRGLSDSLPNAEGSRWQSYVYQLSAVPKSGSGFSIGDGYVVTTADVLEGMQNPVILTDDGLHIQARIVGIDSDFNIGLLQSLAKTTLPALPLGDSASVAAGHFAICIGNQSGQENSVALMMVGGVRKEGIHTIRHFYPSLIQIAGTVGAGASGAPLVDSRGQVIGMMAAIPFSEWTYVPAEGNQPPGFMVGGEGAFPFKPDAGNGEQDTPTQPVPNGSQGLLNPYSPAVSPPPADTFPSLPGVTIGGVTLTPATPQDTTPPVRQKHQRRDVRPVPHNNMFYNGAPPMPMWRPPVTSEGFAIPINDIKPILEDMKTGVHRERVWIGLGTNDQTNTVVKDKYYIIERAVLIQNIFPDSPAARSGIQPGDYLVRLAERPIQSAADVREVMLRLRPGQMVPVEVKRGGDMLTFTLKIEARPEKIQQTETPPEKIMPKPTPMAFRPAHP